jgi:hypothetical protein
MIKTAKNAHIKAIEQKTAANNTRIASRWQHSGGRSYVMK